MNSASNLNERETPDGGLSEDPVFLESADAASWLDHEIGRDSAQEKFANRSMHPKPNWLGRILFVLLLLFFLLVVGVASGLFFGRFWLLSQAEEKALKALADNDIHLAYESAHWEFPRGVVFSDVQLYETAGHKTLLLTASNLGLNQDLYSLVKKRSIDAINATVTFEDAHVTLYHQGQEVAAFENIDSYITGTHRAITIERFEGVFSGLSIDAAGKAILVSDETGSEIMETGDSPQVSGRPQTLGERADFRPVGVLKEWLAITPKGDELPKLEIAFLVPAGPDRKINAEGRLLGRSFSWKDLPVDSLFVEFDYNGVERVLDLPQTNLVYQGAPIDGQLKVKLEEQKVEIASLQSEANLVDLVSRIDPGQAERFAAVEFVDLPEIGLKGTLDLADFWKSDLAIDYMHRSGMTLDLQGRKLPVRGVKSHIAVKDGAISTESLEGSILDGKVRGSFSARKGAEDLSFTTDMKVTELPLQSLADLAGSEEPMPGLLDGSFKGAGGADLALLKGSGDLRIRAEELLRVPVMGEIQDLMGTVAPIFGVPKQSTLDATYTVTDGTLQTKDLEVASDGIRIKAAGSYNLQNKMVAARAHGYIDGLVGAPTELLGKALEVYVEGPVDDLKKRFDNAPAEFSSEAAKAAFATVGATAGAVKDLAEKGLKGGGLLEAGGAAAAEAMLKSGADIQANGEKAAGAAAAVVAGGTNTETGEPKKTEGSVLFLGDEKKLADVLKGQAEKAVKESEEEIEKAESPPPPVEGEAPKGKGDSPRAMPIGPPLPTEAPGASVKKEAPKPEAKVKPVAKPKPDSDPSPEKKPLRAVPLTPSPGAVAPVFSN